MTPHTAESADLTIEDALNVEGYISMYADRHRPEPGGGCTCGFCAWSGEHVALMAYDEARHHIRTSLRVVLNSSPASEVGDES